MATSAVKGRICTAFNSFELRGDDNDFSGDLWTLDFVTARNGELAFRSGTNNRYVAVEVVVAADRLSIGDIDEWEHVVEFTFTFTDPPYLSQPLGAQDLMVDISLQDIHIDEGRTRIRAFTRGRIAASEEQNYAANAASYQSTDPDDLTEQFRIELWPASLDAKDNKSMIIKGDEEQ